MNGRFFRTATCLGLTLGALTLTLPAYGQGKGNGKDKDKQDKPGKSERGPSHEVGRGKAKGPAHARGDDGPSNKGNGSASMGGAIKRVDDVKSRGSDNARFTRGWTTNDFRPSIRQYIASDKNSQRMAAGALAYAYARGVNERDFVFAPDGDRVRVRNRKGDVLLDIDDRRARDVGSWRLNVLGDRVADGAPSFCRSGEGHPVWGRQWCVDKGFNLGTSRNFRWGSTDDLDRNIVWQRNNTASTLAADALARVLGTTVTDRLALHAISLGLVDPLVGRWMGEPNGQRVLLVNSGSTPVAEFVDVDRDDRVDRLLVALMPW